MVSEESLQNLAAGEDSSPDFGTSCPSLEEAGECRMGLKCRYLGAHARRDESGTISLVYDEEKKSRIALTTTEMNHVSPETLKAIRTRKVGFKHSFYIHSCKHRYSTRHLLQMPTLVS